MVRAPIVREANHVLRDRFAAIVVRSPKDGPPRLDFVLKDRPLGGSAGDPSVVGQLRRGSREGGR